MRAVLVIQCPDRPGIVAAISTFLFQHGANITDLDQHSSEDQASVYFMRLESRPTASTRTWTSSGGASAPRWPR